MDTSSRKRVFSLPQNVDTFLYKNVSTFLKEAIILPQDTVDMIFYRVNCIGQAEKLLGSFTAKLPKTKSMFEKHFYFH